MLSLFPVLLSYNLAVPLVFRLVAGVIFLFFGYQNATTQKSAKMALFEKIGLKSGRAWLWILITLEVVGGGMLVVGLWTQGVSLGLSIILSLGLLAKRKNEASLPWSTGFMSLLFLITLSLMFLGPGFYGLDLPL